VDAAAALYLRLSEMLVRSVAMLAIGVMIVAGSIEIVSRGFFNLSFPWTQEVSLLAAMWVYFFAYALVAKHHSYIRVEFLIALLPKPGQWLVLLLTRIFVIAFYVVVGWYGRETIRLLSAFRTDVLELPEYLYVLPLTLGAVDIVVTETIYLVRQLNGRTVPGMETRPAEI
jgi:TRAP-type C4-dicarboxylate transport system permease small subunit